MAKSLASCIQGMPSSDEEEKAQLLSPSSKSSHSATKNSRKMNDEKDLQYALDLLALEHMEVTDEWTRRGESRQTAFDMEREELEFITRTLLEKKARSRYCPLEPFDAEMPKQLERLEFRLREKFRQSGERSLALKSELKDEDSKRKFYSKLIDEICGKNRLFS